MQKLDDETRTGAARHSSGELAKLALPCEAEADSLAFSVHEGDHHNLFFRCHHVAAHLIASSGRRPRIIVAFPTGNTGLGLWFEAETETVEILTDAALSETHRDDGMCGVRTTLIATTAVLRIRAALLGSVRALREYEKRREPRRELTAGIVDGSRVVFARLTVDGEQRIELVLDVHDGGAGSVMRDGTIELSAAPGQRLRWSLTALTDLPPLTPIPLDDLFANHSIDGPNEPAALAVAFLSYREKLLAGSWRFLTYFGRDTLLALRLALPVASASLIFKAGLGAVLDRVGSDGVVAHEESVGEWAALHADQGRHAFDELAPTRVASGPLLDDKMIDDDFLLAPLACAYLLEHEQCRSRAETFLARLTPRGESVRIGACQEPNYGGRASTTLCSGTERENPSSPKRWLQRWELARQRGRSRFRAHPLRR